MMAKRAVWMLIVAALLCVGACTDKGTTDAGNGTADARQACRDLGEIATGYSGRTMTFGDASKRLDGMVGRIGSAVSLDSQWANLQTALKQFRVAFNENDVALASSSLASAVALCKAIP